MKNALLVLAAILVSCLAFEAYLRAAGVSYPILHRLERERGWAPWPGIDGVYTTEGRARVRFNQDGIRGPAVGPGKGEDVYRIAVLGDSMTEAREVEEADTFVARVGTSLSGCGALEGKRVETLNFGVSGYGTAQQLITLERHVLGYGPDLVLLAFYAGNDISNNSRRLDGHLDRPYFVLSEGALVADRETLEGARFAAKYYRRNIWNGIVNRVRLFQFVRDTVNKARTGVRGKARHEPRFRAPSTEDMIFEPPSDEAWREAWRVTERLLEEMGARAAAAGGRFMIAVLSVPVQVTPDKEARREFVARLGIESLFYVEERLASFGDRAGIPVIALGPPMQEIADRDGVFFHGFETSVLGDGHYNAQGHAVVARLIAEGVCGRLSGGTGRR
jgi:lysophospholipase L1-like esterase